MRDLDITRRELIASIAIVFAMIGIGFLISTSIHNAVSTENEKYFKAVKIDKDEDLFGYAIDTSVGNILSHGILKANQTVSDSMVDGEYFSIIKTEEHYVMKTRVVTYTDSNGKTQTRTETYWEWDEIKREKFNTETFNYLGKDFDFNIVKINHHKYLETVKKRGLSSVRWKFYVIPKEFSGTMYSEAKNKTLSKNELYAGKAIEKVMEEKEKAADIAVIVFWIFWVILTGALVFVFIALENRYLNNY